MFSGVAWYEVGLATTIMTNMNKQILRILLAPIAVATLTLSTFAAEKSLPDPDGKSADMSKPVQVYILLGQSNMLGFGKTGGDKEGK